MRLSKATVVAVTAVMLSFARRSHQQSCNPADVPVIQNAKSFNVSDTEAKFLCDEGYSFISGASERISLCGTDGEWVPFADLCSEECPVPRHCADLLKLGLTEKKTYKMVPSGNPQDPFIKADCDDFDGGGWTEVWEQRPAQPSETTHFKIGIENWRSLTQPVGSSEAAVVMRVVLTAQDKTLMAYYDNVTIGPGPDYKLSSIGNYHGDAGDALCDSLGVDFIMDWWTPWIAKDNATTKRLITEMKASYLTASEGFDWKLLWGSVQDIQMVSIYVRPASLDSEKTCPLMINGDVKSSSWSATTQFVEYTSSRLPGAKITYKCIGELQTEGEESGNRTTEGTAICLDETPPRWNRSVTLPCRFACDEGYTESTKANECYKAYTDPNELKFLESAHRCTAEGAHLVRVEKDYLDDFLLNQSSSYFTAHTGKYHSSGSTFSEASYKCSNSSACNLENNCLAVSSPQNATLTSCSEAKGSICMMPSVCPKDYKRAVGGGSCFKIMAMDVKKETNYKDFLSMLGDRERDCASTGGGLAQPTSLSDFESMISFIRAEGGKSQTLVLLGLTQLENGTWISNTFINDSTLNSHFNSSAWGSVILDVSTTSHQFVTETADVDAFLCMWPGQSECMGTPPEPSENMTRSNVFDTLGHVVKYKCYFGYFINGNASIAVGQTYRCVGGSGDWLYDRSHFTELQDCIKVPVCQSRAEEQLSKLRNLGLEPNASAIPGDLKVDSPEFVNGTISYACPAGKATKDDDREQRWVCRITNPDAFDTPQEFDLSGPDVQMCPKCADPPDIVIENSSSDYQASNTYLDGSDGKPPDFFNINCNGGYAMPPDVTSVKIHCTPSGWNFTGVQNCSAVCTGKPREPPADSHMAREPLLLSTEGTVLHYNCTEGYYFGLDESNELQSRATETCNTSTGWVQDPPNFELRCYHICNWKNVTIQNAKSNYESDHTQETYTNGSMLEVECEAGYEWSFNKTKQTFECTNDGWNSTHGKDCVKVCPAKDVPAAGARATRSDVVANTPGTKLKYTCARGYKFEPAENNGSPSDLSEVELTCNAKGEWEASVGVKTYDCKHPCGAGDVDIANATSNFDSSLDYSHLANLSLTLTCQPGFEWRFNDTKQNISCTSTGWDTSNVQPCHPACPADAPPAGAQMTRDPVTNNSIGAEVSYYCTAGFFINFTHSSENDTARNCSNSSNCKSGSDELKRTTKAVCSEDGVWTNIYPNAEFKCLHECMILLPSLVNADTDFDASKNYSHLSNESLTATCHHGYEFAFNKTVQIVECHAIGWSTQHIKPCYKACIDPIEPAGEEMTVEHLTKNTINTTMTYTCNDGFYLNTTEDNPNITNTATVTCRDDGSWHYDREDLYCVTLCEDEPPEPVGNSSTNWNNYTRVAGTSLTYSCPDQEIFGNMNSSLEITCDNGTWTSFSESFMTCALPCIDQNPPANISNAYPEKEADFREGDFLVYNCPPNMATLEGENRTVLQCLPEVGWQVNSTEETLEEISKRFLCSDACPGPAVEPDTNWDSNWTSVFLTGTVIWYNCPNASYVDTDDVDVQRELINECKDNEWTFIGLHYCLDTPPAASTTEATVIDTPSPPYSETAYSYYSVLQNNMTDTDEINATYVATDAPFGFGYAVKIDRVQKQCLKQTDFPEKARPKCMSNPIKCNDTGLSFSIWEKHTYTQDEFIRSGNNQLKESDKKYVLSTGGDTMGHPGIAFYHYGIFQYVVVSTGDEYWEVRVPGLMENATWANIGFSWLPTVTENPDGTKSGGLELYINKKLEGRSFYPKATGGAKPGLNPDELMLGCHKTNESSVYRYFGDGEYDELAYWKRALADNETDYFLGGYLEDFSHLTTEEMSEKLANIDMKNPDTLGDALVVVEQMSRQHERPTSAPETTASDIASLASSSPTPAGPNSLQALKEAEDLKRREDLLDILQRMYAEENSADVLTYSQADKLLSGLSAVSNLMSADSASDWKKIQANGSAGSADLMWSSVNFARRTFCSIKYDNNTKPFTVVKGFENLIFYGQKMLYEDLKARGKYVQIPDYGNEKLKPYKTKWNQVFDMGRVMTNVLNDNHCDKRPVCLMTIVFNTYDDIGPTPVNIANIPGDREHEMGARLLYGSLTSDKARDANGKVNYSAPLCQLDKFTMSRNPFYTKLENKVRVPALRQLRFHSDEVVTKVSTRRCAFWNEKLSDFGAWDTDGCQVVDSNEMYTKCTCEKFGSMMVLDEKVQDPAVPPDPSWLNIVKFVLYCISAVVLVFYCIVVAVSSDLKEQFHLMGMYLSISVLIGSISMLVSDLDAIRDSRHLCTTLSTITHYFYVAAGLWVACLGHASFKAITSGEVGGKLNSYSCISWGVAMFSVGVPYAFFVRDLGTDPRCFVTWENNGKAAFFLPQVACVCIAFFFGVVVLFNLSTPALRKENLVEDYGSFCRGAAFVMLYFAITWTFGLLAYMRFGISVDFYPLFQVFNSAMGIIIVIFIGIASYRFRTVLVGKAKSRHEKIKSLAGIKKSKLEEEQPSPKRPRSTKEKSPERPATQSSLHPPQQRGQVAGRPGSRPVTPNE